MRFYSIFERDEFVTEKFKQIITTLLLQRVYSTRTGELGERMKKEEKNENTLYSPEDQTGPAIS